MQSQIRGWVKIAQKVFATVIPTAPKPTNSATVGEPFSEKA
jgi:hypothetical protein